jgi:hypothetical protein
VDAATDLAMALDRVVFARSVGVEADLWQADLLRSSARRMLLNCSRQSGKSTVAALLALHQAVYDPRSLVLVLAPALRQSQELFSKIREFYGSLDAPVPPLAHRRLSLELENGSRIVTLPGTEKTVRGFSGASLLVVDEASRVDDALYYGVRPMLAVSGGRLIMLSTPFGKRGVFYREWTSGESWERYQVKATECPRIPSTFLEEEKRNMPATWFAQEYECSFVDAEGAVFAHDDVMAALDSRVRPLFGRR